MHFVALARWLELFKTGRHFARLTAGKALRQDSAARRLAPSHTYESENQTSRCPSSSSSGVVTTADAASKVPWAGPHCFFRIRLGSTLSTRWIVRSRSPIGFHARTDKLDRVRVACETPSSLSRHPLSLEVLVGTRLVPNFRTPVTQTSIVQPLRLLCDCPNFWVQKAGEHVWSHVHSHGPLFTRDVDFMAWIDISLGV
jgi:hypothetical protein